MKIVEINVKIVEYIKTLTVCSEKWSWWSLLNKYADFNRVPLTLW